MSVRAGPDTPGRACRREPHKILKPHKRAGIQWRLADLCRLLARGSGGLRRRRGDDDTATALVNDPWAWRERHTGIAQLQRPRPQQQRTDKGDSPAPPASASSRTRAACQRRWGVEVPVAEQHRRHDAAERQRAREQRHDDERAAQTGIGQRPVGHTDDEDRRQTGRLSRWRRPGSAAAVHAESDRPQERAGVSSSSSV